MSELRRLRKQRSKSESEREQVNDSHASEKMRGDLRHLTPNDAERLRFEPLSESETLKLTYKMSRGEHRFYECSYKIPYFAIDGTPTDFFTLRLTKSKASLYPPLAPKPYLTLGLDWKSIARDPRIELFVVHDEREAAYVCIHGGIPCVCLPSLSFYGAEELGEALARDVVLRNRKVIQRGD